MKNKLIDILNLYDPEIIDSLKIVELMDGCLYIIAETRERASDVLMILLNYDDCENDEFLNNIRITLDMKRNRIEFINTTHKT